MFLNNQDVSPLTKGRVVMDIEKPFPSGLWMQPPRMRARLVRAFATRAEAARLKFPNAKLGFYGTLVPDSRGRENDPEQVARKAALVKAGECGMFDEVDFLVPVAYPRFGPNDGAAWNTYEPYTRLAIEDSRQIHKSDGSSLPVLPFLTCWIANSDENSKHAHDVLLDLPVPDPLEMTLGKQFDVLLEEGVRTAVVWVGKNTAVIKNDDKTHNPNNRTVAEHVCFRGPPKDKNLPARTIEHKPRP
jgi:hypothetical protein